MTITVSKELMDIFASILRENKSESEWAEIESDDMFQSDHFRGGFDSTEMAFCFSYFDDHRTEYWFQLSLDEIRLIFESGEGQVSSRPAEFQLESTV